MFHKEQEGKNITIFVAIIIQKETVLMMTALCKPDWDPPAFS